MTKDSQLRRCTAYKTAWEKLESRNDCSKDYALAQSEINGHLKVDGQSPLGKGDTAEAENFKNSVQGQEHRSTNTFTLTFTCISDCIDWLCQHRLNSKDLSSETQVNKTAQQNGENSKELSSSNKAGKVSDQSVKNEIKKAHLQVLVTGSLHLVGGALKVIWDKELMDD